MHLEIGLFYLQLLICVLQKSEASDHTMKMFGYSIVFLQVKKCNDQVKIQDDIVLALVVFQDQEQSHFQLFEQKALSPSNSVYL